MAQKTFALILLALPSAALAQFDGFPNPTVSLNEQPARLEMILPKLAAELKVSLDVRAMFKNDVFVVRTVDVAAQEILARIAKIENAQWRRDDKGLHLEPREGAAAEEQRADR